MSGETLNTRKILTADDKIDGKGGIYIISEPRVRILDYQLMKHHFEVIFYDEAHNGLVNDKNSIHKIIKLLNKTTLGEIRARVSEQI